MILTSSKITGAKPIALRWMAPMQHVITNEVGEAFCKPYLARIRVTSSGQASLGHFVDGLSTPGRSPCCDRRILPDDVHLVFRRILLMLSRHADVPSRTGGRRSIRECGDLHVSPTQLGAAAWRKGVATALQNLLLSNSGNSGPFSRQRDKK